MGEYKQTPMLVSALGLIVSQLPGFAYDFHELRHDANDPFAFLSAFSASFSCIFLIVCITTSHTHHSQLPLFHDL